MLPPVNNYLCTLDTQKVNSCSLNCYHYCTQRRGVQNAAEFLCQEGVTVDKISLYMH